MKTINQESGKEKWSFALGIALGAIGGWLLAKGNKNNNQSYSPKETFNQSLSEGSPEMDTKVVTPIIWGSGDEFQKFVKKNNKLFAHKYYTREEVIDIISRYVKRVINVIPKDNQPGQSHRGRTQVVKENEPLVIYLPYDIVDILLKIIPQTNPENKQGGLMAIFAIDTISRTDLRNKNHTFVLMPYDQDGKAIIQNNATYGVERWDAEAKKLSTIIGNDSSGNIGLDAIASKVDMYLKNDIERKS